MIHIKYKNLLFGLFLIASSFAATLVYIPVASAAQSNSCDNNRFLTLPPWYRGLTDGSSDCAISVDNMPDPGAQKGGKLAVFIQVLALNIVEILMHIVAYVSVAFVIVGGFKYITSAGSPDGNSKGRQTIMNALIGLVISIASIGIVNFITGGLI